MSLATWLFTNALAGDSTPAQSALLSGAVDAPAALSLLQAQGPEASSTEDVQYALEHGWWEPAKHMLRTMRERGDAVTTMQSVRTTATRIRDEATEVINLLRVGANKEETVVNCAFQWAQRPDFVYLNVKYSSRLDGPVTVLNVDNEVVTFTNETFSFEGIGRQKPKKMQLKLAFHKEIDPNRSTWSLASVGRLSITLAKVEIQAWPQLLAKTAIKPKNMHAWYDRQTVLDEQVKKEAKVRKEREDKEKSERETAEREAKETAEKEKKAAGKAEDAATPPPPPPDGESPPPPPPAADGEPKATKKKAKKGKKAKKKTGAKEEL